MKTSRIAGRESLLPVTGSRFTGLVQEADEIVGAHCGLAPEFQLLHVNGAPASASVTGAIGLRGWLHFLRRAEMMTALVSGFPLSL